MSNAGGYLGGQKSKNLVNVVCERPLTTPKYLLIKVYFSFNLQILPNTAACPAQELVLLQEEFYEETSFKKITLLPFSFVSNNILSWTSCGFLYMEVGITSQHWISGIKKSLIYPPSHIFIDNKFVSNRIQIRSNALSFQNVLCL